MSFVRPLVREGAMARPMVPGDGLAANYNITVNNTNANTTIPVSAILGGLISRGGMSANRTDTTPTAAELVAALPDMNVGDTFSCKVANHDTGAETVTINGGSGVTRISLGGIPPQTSREMVFELTNKTAGSEAFNLYLL